MTGTFCAFCGWPELYENEDGTLDCRNCVWEWPSRAAYFAEISDFSRSDWQHWDPFFKVVMSGPIEAVLVKAAARLFLLKTPIQIVEAIMQGINASAPTPLPPGQVAQLLVDAAFAA